MATSTRYHLLPDENRASEVENAADNEPLLLPANQRFTPLKKRFQIAGYPTIFTRLVTICFLLPAFILLARDHSEEGPPFSAFAMISIIWNVYTLICCCGSRRFKVQVEIGRRSFSLPFTINRPHYFRWLTIELVIDILVWLSLFLSTTVNGIRILKCVHWLCHMPDFRLGTIFSGIASGFYLVSMIDGGNPGSLKASADFSIDEKDPHADSLASEASGQPVVTTSSSASPQLV